MPRGKVKTLEEKLADVRANIEEENAALEALKAAEQNLLDQIRQRDIKALENLMEEKGITVQELKELIEKK